METIQTVIVPERNNLNTYVITPEDQQRIQYVKAMKAYIAVMVKNQVTAKFNRKTVNFPADEVRTMESALAAATHSLQRRSLQLYYAAYAVLRGKLLDVKTHGSDISTNQVDEILKKYGR